MVARARDEHVVPVPDGADPSGIEALSLKDLEGVRREKAQTHDVAYGDFVPEHGDGDIEDRLLDDEAHEQVRDDGPIARKYSL
jgi:hypothetical protein